MKIIIIRNIKIIFASLVTLILVSYLYYSHGLYYLTPSSILVCAISNSCTIRRSRIDQIAEDGA